jgi:hypothetical protein
MHAFFDVDSTMFFSIPVPMDWWIYGTDNRWDGFFGDFHGFYWGKPTFFIGVLWIFHVIYIKKQEHFYGFTDPRRFSYNSSVVHSSNTLLDISFSQILWAAELGLVYKIYIDRFWGHEHMGVSQVMGDPQIIHGLETSKKRDGPKQFLQHFGGWTCILFVFKG